MKTAAKILVVEDNQMLLALLERALGREGYEVIPAPSGVAMMKVLYAGKPDLIVLDVGLPDVDGHDLLAALKKDPRTRAIPVLVWSGGSTESDRRTALDLGAEDYVKKGPPAALVAKVQRVFYRLNERNVAGARASAPPKAG